MNVNNSSQKSALAKLVYSVFRRPNLVTWNKEKRSRRSSHNRFIVFVTCNVIHPKIAVTVTFSLLFIENAL